jgi:transcriptional regulator with XRE-family HTH domain
MKGEEIANLINALFRTYKRSDGQEYSNKEVCDALGDDIEASHLSRLRKGKIANPGRDTLLALCRFFRVPPSYFFPELQTAEHNTDSSPEHVEENDPMLQIALKSTGITPEVQEKLEQLIRALRQQK